MDNPIAKKELEIILVPEKNKCFEYTLSTDTSFKVKSVGANLLKPSEAFPVALNEADSSLKPLLEIVDNFVDIQPTLEARSKDSVSVFSPEVSPS